MAISASHLHQILAPTLQKAFSTVYTSNAVWDMFTNQPARYDPVWLEQYNIERKRLLHGREWTNWLAKHTPTVRDRLDRLNPNSCTPGMVPRGWSPANKNAPWAFDVVPVKEYIKKWGNHPGHVDMKHGRRKFVNRTRYLDGPVTLAPCPNENCCHVRGHAGACSPAPF